MSRKKTRELSRDISLVTYHEKQENSLKITLVAKNDEQKNMLKCISENTITFVKGPAGTGKTFIAVSYALQQLFKEQYSQIVFSRPVIEAAGEKLGFLPGDMSEKINPYMIPVFETLLQMIPNELLNKLLIKNGKQPQIRILPLAYMRGVSFKNSIIIVDEAQNTTVEQMRMLLTRIGENCKMIIGGDVYQSDIRSQNGLKDAFELLTGIDGVGFATLSEKSIVRHPIIEKIDSRYMERNKQKLDELELSNSLQKPHRSYRRKQSSDEN